MGNYNQTDGVLTKYTKSVNVVNDIGSEITALGPKCFEHMTALTSVTIPQQIEEIRYGAFLGCTRLSNCIIQNDSKLSAIDALAFYGCSALTSVNLPISLKRSDHYAFMYSGIRSTTIPNMTVSSLFPIECAQITSITLPENSIVQPYAFAGCPRLNLDNIEINDNVSAFMPKSLDGLNYTTNNNKKIVKNKWIVGWNGSPEEIICGQDDERGIVGEAFAHNHSLTKVTIKNNIKTIGLRAFYDCPNLTSIEFDEKSLSDIRQDMTANYGKWGVTEDQLIPKLEDGVILYTTISNPHIWNEARYGNDSGIYFDDETSTFIGFDKKYNVCKIIIPNTINNKSITSIYDNAFYWCQNLSHIIIPNSITAIGDKAFAYCTNLSSINIPNIVTAIKSGTFKECTNLLHISIPDSVTLIQQDAFYNCQKLTSLEIGDHVTHIDARAFAYCSSLTSVTIPNTVTDIGPGAFSHCSGLTGTLTLPKSVRNIGSNAFQICNRLERIIFNGKTQDDIDSMAGHYWGLNENQCIPSS